MKDSAIPRVEAQRAHQEFVQAARPPTVMMKITHARRLYRQDETFDSFFYPGIEVITTTTINDTQLNLLPWEEEWNIVREMNPDYHIPTDYSDYASQPFEERQENIEKCLEGAVWMSQKINDNDDVETKLLPLLKGVTPEERELCYQVFEGIGWDTAAFYATRYFTAGRGNNITALVDDLETIHSETDIDIFLIGLLSPQYLSRLPTNVTAAAGQKQWREEVTPSKQSDEEIANTFETVWEEIRTEIPRQ